MNVGCRDQVATEVFAEQLGYGVEGIGIGRIVQRQESLLFVEPAIQRLGYPIHRVSVLSVIGRGEDNFTNAGVDCLLDHGAHPHHGAW